MEADRNAATAEQARDWRSWLPVAVLLVAVMVGVFVRFHRIADPIGGFHSFNEGFYYTLAEGDVERPLLAWLLDPSDINNPPLYTLVLTTLFRLFSPSVALARSVSVVAGLGTLPLLYLLARRVFDRRVALVATAIAALAPGAVLVNHNNQVDSLLVLLEVGAILAYVTAVARKDDRFALLAGVLLGLALMTKLPAVLIIPSLAVWETWRTRGLAWLKKRRVRVALGAFSLVGLGWYLTQLALNGPGYLATQTALGQTIGLPSAAEAMLLLVNEPFWMLSPVAAVTAILGVAYIAWQRRSGDQLVLSVLGVQMVFFALYHFHSYYLLPIVPFAALAAARLVVALAERAPRVTWTGYAAGVAAMVLYAFLIMAANKWGHWTPLTIREALGDDLSATRVYIDSTLHMNWGPAVEMYLDDAAEVVRLPEDELPSDPEPLPGVRDVLIMRTALVSAADRTPAPSIADLEQESVRVIAFGLVFAQTPVNLHFFGARSINVEQRYPIWRFGLQREPAAPGAFIYDVEALFGS